MALTSIIILMLAFIIAADLFISYYCYRSAVIRTNKHFIESDPELIDWVEKHPEALKQEWYDRQSFKEVTVVSFDGLKLRGCYLKADKPDNRVAILVHGYTADARSMGEFAEFYHDRLGFDVLMPDARGHGLSEGNYRCFGWHDRKDIIKWIDYILQLKGDDCRIVLHGVSMGGATVLMASGENLHKNVKAIISDCSYTSAWEELSYQFKRRYHLPSFPIIHTTSFITKLLAGYSFGEASARKQVSKSKTPVLFIHGNDDSFVPFDMVKLLFDACGSKKDLFIVQGAGHGTSHQQDKAGYEKKTAEFIKMYM